jgi:hypothetical protein
MFKNPEKYLLLFCDRQCESEIFPLEEYLRSEIHAPQKIKYNLLSIITLDTI